MLYLESINNITLMQHAEYKTTTTTVRKIEDNIFENHIIAHKTVEREHIYEVKKANLKLANGKPYALLVTKGEFSLISAEVRAIISSKEFAQNTVAKALVTDSVADKIIGQFYIKINKPHITTKLFVKKDRDIAMVWLREQLVKHAALQIQEINK